MDVQTALVGVAVFAVSGFVLFIIYKFGIKEKSYEEALAEQRQNANVLLGAPSRPKPKDKKIKKANKKAKEKQTATVTETEESEEVESNASSINQKHHVEFKEPTIIEDIPVVPVKQSKRVRKVRPILLHKSEENITKETINPIPISTLNHFEQLHPKDDLELLHTNLQVKEEKPEKTQVKPKQEEKEKKLKQNVEVKENKDVKPKEKVKEKQLNGNVEKKQVQEAAQSQPPPPLQQVNGFVKEKKKKKEVNVLQQLAGTRDADITLQMLQNVVRKAELTRSEVQILIDLLLNKQHEAPEVIDEWTEGKTDPVQKLKKQLAEKEKLLQAEQEACSGVQLRLKELRNELNTEKAHAQQRQRTLEETIQSVQFDLQAANAHYQKQIQNLQQANSQLVDERTNFQLQRQQLEIRLQQMQEAEASIIQLRNEIADLQGRNQQLTMDVHALNEQNMAKEHQQGIIVQLQHQVNHFKAEADQKDDIYKELEEVRRNLDHQINISHRQENELKMENSHLKSTCQKQVEEVRRLELAENQAKDKLRLLTKQKEESDHLVNQLKVEIQDIQAEKSELQALKANGVTEASNTLQEEILNLQNELASLQHKLDQFEKEHMAEVELSRRLENDLEEQRNKNNELRKKNWKVMEALNLAESRIKSSNSRSNEDLLTQIRIEQQQLNKSFLERVFPDVKVSTKELSYDSWLSNFEKILREQHQTLEEQKELSHKDEVAKLNEQVDHYKKAIDETEMFLKKLEDHVVQEEINWRRKLKAKEAEIETLKQTNGGCEFNYNKLEMHNPDSLGVQFAYKCIEKSLPMIVDELEVKVSQLQSELRKEQQGREILQNEIEIYKNLHN